MTIMTKLNTCMHVTSSAQWCIATIHNGCMKFLEALNFFYKLKHAKL